MTLNTKAQSHNETYKFGNNFAFIPVKSLQQYSSDITNDGIICLFVVFAFYDCFCRDRRNSAVLLYRACVNITLFFILFQSERISIHRTEVARLIVKGHIFEKQSNRMVDKQTVNSDNSDKVKCVSGEKSILCRFSSFEKKEKKRNVTSIDQQQNQFPIMNEYATFFAMRDFFSRTATSNCFLFCEWKVY